MALPLLTRVADDDVAFALTRRSGTPASRIGTTTVDLARLPSRRPAEGEQYRFHFDMRKCIGCKCCVVACNEQNGNPASINWRRVSEIEGGWFPQATRSYLSMGCNHCLEPTCLEGCPVDAYTKDPATGIVGHSADACIGCQVLHVELLLRRAAIQPGARASSASATCATAGCRPAPLPPA